MCRNEYRVRRLWIVCCPSCCRGQLGVITCELFMDSSSVSVPGIQNVSQLKYRFGSGVKMFWVTPNNLWVPRLASSLSVVPTLRRILFGRIMEITIFDTRRGRPYSFGWNGWIDIVLRVTYRHWWLRVREVGEMCVVCESYLFVCAFLLELSMPSFTVQPDERSHSVVTVSSSLPPFRLQESIRPCRLRNSWRERSRWFRVALGLRERSVDDSCYVNVL